MAITDTMPLSKTIGAGPARGSGLWSGGHIFSASRFAPKISPVRQLRGLRASSERTDSGFGDRLERGNVMTARCAGHRCCGRCWHTSHVPRAKSTDTFDSSKYSSSWSQRHLTTARSRSSFRASPRHAGAVRPVPQVAAPVQPDRGPLGQDDFARADTCQQQSSAACGGPGC